MIVEDRPEVARLLGKLFRREGYEVAEVGDHQVALTTLSDEAEPVDGVLVSFSLAGPTACLKLLDALRNHPDPEISRMRAVLLLDFPRQQVLCWQSGADEILIRPLHADDLVAAVGAALRRADADRSEYRREQIERVKTERIQTPTGAGHDPEAGGVARFS